MKNKTTASPPPDLGDGRTRAARRYRQLIGEMVSDAGGPDLVSTAKMQLINRAASLMLQCELADYEVVSTGRALEAKQAERYASNVSILARVCKLVGLNRVARDVTGKPDLKKYLEQMASGELVTIEHDDAQAGRTFGEIVAARAARPPPSLP